MNNCPEGEIPDCQGNCAPESWVGDFWCDNGTATWNGIPIYFSCWLFYCDGGVCPDELCDDCPEGEISDCYGNCAPESWPGDGFCDDGTYTWNTIPIYFNCWYFNCDEGDCPPEMCPCAPGEIEDCNGSCAPESWIGDGYCDDGTYAWNGIPIYFDCWEFNCDGGDCPPEACGCPIIYSQPPNCAIDARQPHHIYNHLDRYGWSLVDITFGCDLPPLVPADFAVEQIPPGPPPAPPIVDVMNSGGGLVTLVLPVPINPGFWTCFASPLVGIPGDKVCFGYLPADADSDRTAAPADILTVIDHLNNVILRPIYSVDMDRDGDPGPADILRLIDFLNGAGSFEPWLDRSLPPCPSE